MERPKFKDIIIPEWRKYDKGYDIVPINEYINKLEIYITYLENYIKEKENA